MNHDIFISYSSNDKIVADAVVAALENRGIRCWYAPRDIKAGTDWGESITNAISDCALMLLIFSESSNGSKRVLDEIYYSISEGKTILPFRIENLDPSGAMRLHLSSRHWLDAYDPSWEAHINKLIDTATSNLDKEATLSDNMALISPTSKGPESKNLPWKLIGSILAVGVVIAGVVGIINLRGSGGAEPLPTATEDVVATKEVIPTEEPATPTQTLIATPTIIPFTPTIEPAPRVLSDAVLTLKDLPSGFEAIALDEFGLSKEDLNVEGFTVDEIFAFMGYDPFEMIMGFTTLLPTDHDQAGFDVALGQPEFLMDTFILGMGATEVQGQKELTHLNNIGDASVGFTMIADMGGIPMRMDMVVLRRDVAGAFLFVFYIDGTVPVITIDEVSGKMDDRFVEVLSLDN